MSMVILQEDPQWLQFVHWVVTAIFYAEENGISKGSAAEMPTVQLFGTDFTFMFRQSISFVGSYGEIYARNLGEDFPRDFGPNALNAGGALHYPPTIDLNLNLQCY